MTRTVREAVYVLAAMMGEDPTDPATLKNPLTQDQLLSALDKSSLDQVKIGIAREGFFDHLNEEKKEIMNRAIEQLKGAGASIVDDVVIPSAKEKWSIDVLVYEFKANLNAYLANVSAQVPVRTLTDVIRFNQEDSEQRLRYGQSLLTKSDKTKGTLTEKEYLDALQFDQYHSSINGIDAALEKDQLDVLVFPNNYGAAIPAKAGYPSITVPAGYTAEGEPVGITFTGTAFSEEKLIQIAAAFEELTKARLNPTFEF
ncbi:amidase [Halalkalibacter akibai JCM 9157]|uniref:Amidase n=1 Tax=Halalkalibacter akibai (strain ATCC 43226 / DSM 21942 / CIP 109018 / JCM 9157 / 1139) TaxID=1236973 RepID=W4QY27_HALA3|nr:amidase [Halalkalibacter akibai JCM 9157]